MASSRFRAFALANAPWSPETCLAMFQEMSDLWLKVTRHPSPYTDRDTERLYRKLAANPTYTPTVNATVLIFLLRPQSIALPKSAIHWLLVNIPLPEEPILSSLASALANAAGTPSSYSARRVFNRNLPSLARLLDPDKLAPTPLPEILTTHPMLHRGLIDLIRAHDLATVTFSNLERLTFLRTLAQENDADLVATAINVYRFYLEPHELKDFADTPSFAAQMASAPEWTHDGQPTNRLATLDAELLSLLLKHVSPQCASDLLDKLEEVDFSTWTIAQKARAMASEAQEVRTMLFTYLSPQKKSPLQA